MARKTITGADPPAVVVVATPLEWIDPDGEVAKALRTRYQVVDVVGGNRIYRLRPASPRRRAVSMPIDGLPL